MATTSREAVQAARPRQRRTAPRYAKLRPGPGRAAEEVADDQRARLRAAMIELTGERGYDAVRVRELVRLAGVSSHTFYDRFGCKEECLLASYVWALRRTAQGLAAACNGSHNGSGNGARNGHSNGSGNGSYSPRVRLLHAFRALAEAVERQPCAARLALLEAPPVLKRAASTGMRRADQLLEASVAASLAEAAGGVVPPLLAKGIVSGVAQVLRARLLEGRERELSALAEPLAEWVLCFCDEAVGELGALRSPASPLVAVRSPGDEAAFGYSRSPGDERAMILAAVTQLAAEKGYRELTVPRIRAKAGVSRRCFDAHFASVADCFLTMCQLRGRRALAEAGRLAAAGRSWQGGVQWILASLCAQIASRPELSRLTLVEIAAAGQEGMRCKSRLTAAAANRLHASAPPEHRPGELATEASVGAIWGILEHHVVTGRTQALRHAIPTLSLLALAPPVGAPAAVEAVRDALQPREAVRCVAGARR